MFNFDKRRLMKKAQEVLKLEEKFSKMTDDELFGKTEEFKKRVRDGESLDKLLPEAYAAVREASHRTLGMKHYPVQVIGGIVLHEGRIAEMRTGEGKTLTETLPAYLNALTGKGVHIVTVNEYLAERDMMLMRPIYEFLGLTCDVVLSNKSFPEKKAAYEADITYITNHDVGFDYLKDHLAKEPDQLLQRGQNFVIIDEVDSILIDEARTPLIITREKEGTSQKYLVSNSFVSALKKADIELNEKDKFVGLSESGVHKAEKFFGLKTYTDISNDMIHFVNQSLRAHYLMKKDRDYVVINGEVVIVDEFTGRLGVGRRFSSGLHEAIEAKEGVPIKNESRTLASITYQNLFRGYHKMSGMTGTAKTEEKEFMEIYGLDVVVVDTNRPIVRKDHEDRIYTSREIKLKAVLNEIVETHKKGQPVLVGTTSVERSEELSNLLSKHQIPHTLLNAKNHEAEAEIIKEAGQLGQVTIATNMAGRGTDIILGEGVKEVGGLKVIGTERHESRRIDNQLKGRSGRQGDPGESIFFLSVEDELLRLFVGEKIEALLGKVSFDEDLPISHPFLSKQVVSAQKMVEGINFDSRKHTIQYDDVLNQQRKILYKERDKVLMDDVDFNELIKSYGVESIPEDDAFIRTVKHQLLSIVDDEWISHVDEMVDLKQDAANESYQGKDPITYYIMESRKMFDERMENIQERTKKYVERLKEYVKALQEEEKRAV